MPCAFCKTAMNEGATVCHACGRKQAATYEQKKERWGFAMMFVVALAVFGWFGTVMWNEHARNVAADRIAAAAKLCGKGKTMTPLLVRVEIDEMRKGGADERAAERMVMFEACGFLPRPR